MCSTQASQRHVEAETIAQLPHKAFYEGQNACNMLKWAVRVLTAQFQARHVTCQGDAGVSPSFPSLSGAANNWIRFRMLSRCCMPSGLGRLPVAGRLGRNTACIDT